ncbi:hypothetical protein SCP_0302500 [Sparassis crispa]|uniref:Uncharacterized protein n=1 Tax=Sparassis crispa TaxID=139825 RepID=A0A401GEI6_9APHY|nr:hypothetical protein SCP_0302500 [Sparassis crispa]GBE80535.1 hypothetical protein SCP_0302500 [Sparassis crispa]
MSDILHSHIHVYKTVSHTVPQLNTTNDNLVPHIPIYIAKRFRMPSFCMRSVSSPQSRHRVVEEPPSLPPAVQSQIHYWYPPGLYYLPSWTPAPQSSCQCSQLVYSAGSSSPMQAPFVVVPPARSPVMIYATPVVPVMPQ